jgi:hypothetical protein
MMSLIARGAAWIALTCVLAAAARGDSVPIGYDAGQFYNLGNAYARAGQPGLAVLSYERARLLAPTDEDIEINLRRVRQAAHVSMVGVLGLAGVILAGLSGIAWRRAARRWRLLAAGAAVGACLVGLAFVNAWLVWPKLHSAVVIAAEAPVRAAPALLGEALFVLPEAETVDITAQHEDFVLVKTLQGRTGWMPRAAVALIVPRK